MCGGLIRMVTVVTLPLMMLWGSPDVNGGDVSDDVAFVFVGDIMPGTDYPDSSRLPGNDGRFLLTAPSGIIAAADVAVGNLEGAVTFADSAEKAPDDSLAYAFRIPSILISRLAEAGFDVLNTANNHANDFGPEMRLETEATLDSVGIAHTGRKGIVAQLTVRGLDVRVVGFSYTRGVNSLLNPDLDCAAALVSSLDREADIVAVTFHGGAEGPDSMHLPDGEEEFHGENRGDLRRFAHAMIDAGADIVAGHGPHVPRAVEVYRDRLIAYSLGNFCTWYGLNVRDECGLAPLLWVTTTSDGALKSFTIHSFEQQRYHHPMPDPARQAERLMRELSIADIGCFPDSLYRAHSE
jgi:hypothetical protein